MLNTHKSFTTEHEGREAGVA